MPEDRLSIFHIKRDATKPPVLHRNKALTVHDFPVWLLWMADESGHRVRGEDPNDSGYGRRACGIDSLDDPLRDRARDDQTIRHALYSNVCRVGDCTGDLLRSFGPGE